METLEGWAGKVERYWVNILAIFANLAGVLVVGAAFLADHGRNLVTYYVLSMLTALWGLLILQEYRYARKSSYSEVTRYFHSAIHFLRDTIDEVPKMSNKELARNLQTALGPIATAFSISTRTACRTCVKVLSLAPDTPTDKMLSRTDSMRFLLVRTFARNSSEDDLPKSADWVTENSDFYELFNNPTENCFFENDLCKRLSSGRYRNSHIPSNHNNKADAWPLAYRSTIVWPIRHVTDENSEPDLLGFLCVDSGARNVFVHRYDSHLGAAFADALYMYMSQQPAAFALGGGGQA